MSDGSLDRYKACLVELGNKQEYGIEYDKTFAPIAKMTTIQILLTIAASRSWILFQMNVKNVFLHGDQQEDVYMRLPLGLSSSSLTKVCQLLCSHYGLKQAPRAWFQKLCKTLLHTGFQQSQYDLTLFPCNTSHCITILLVCVDDIIITGGDPDCILQLQKFLRASFHMKDLGPLTYFLGLQVHNIQGGLFINQHEYTRDVIAQECLQKHDSCGYTELNVKYN